MPTSSYALTALPGIDSWGGNASARRHAAQMEGAGATTTSASSRPAKRNWADDLHATIEDITTRGTNKATSIEQEEMRRRAESLGTLRGVSSSLDTPWMSDLDSRRAFAAKSDQTNRDYSKNLQGLRTAVGASGVAPDSGMVDALASRYAAQRAGSLTDATLSLYEKRVDLDVQRRLAKIGAETAIAQKQGEDPSMIGMDWLANSGTLALGEAGVNAQIDAAKTAAKAGKKSGFEQVLSALPVIGGFL